MSATLATLENFTQKHSAATATATIAMANGNSICDSITLCVVFYTVSVTISVTTRCGGREHMKDFCCYLLLWIGLETVVHNVFTHNTSHTCATEFLSVLLAPIYSISPSISLDAVRTACTAVTLSCAEHKPSQSIVAPNKYVAYN